MTTSTTASDFLMLTDAEGNFYRFPVAVARQHAVDPQVIGSVIRQGRDRVDAPGIPADLRDEWTTALGQVSDVEGQDGLTIAALVMLKLVGVAVRIHLANERAVPDPFDGAQPEPTPPCPKCESLQVELMIEGVYLCNNCDTRW